MVLSLRINPPLPVLEFQQIETCVHGKVTGAGVYEYREIATVYVEPNDGYRFVEWSDGNEYNPRVFVVEGDMEVEAICEVVAGVEDVEESVAFYIQRRGRW